jgi:C4-dicarboxylate transporter, DctM subunit
MNAIVVGAVGFVILLIIMFMGMPVSFSMILAGFLGFTYVVNSGAAQNVIPGELLSVFSNYSLTSVPMFVLMGEIAFVAGISDRLYDAGQSILGQVKGGLAMASIAACAGFAAICGSTVATAAAMGKVAIPQMQRYGYDASLATGSIASAGTLGILIPPSSTFIIYGIMTEQSIGKLFIAGVLPGLMLASIFTLTVYILCRRNPRLGPAGPPTTMKQKVSGVTGVFETILIFCVVIGGLFLGWFTPSQAGAAGAMAILVAALVRRSITFKGFIQGVKSTTFITAFLLMILAGGLIFGRFIAITKLPFMIANGVTSLEVPHIVILAIIIMIHIVGGCFMDAFALIVLTIPIFFPVILALGYDPIWYGVMIVLLVEMAAITPPVGLNVFVIKGIAPDVPLNTIYKGIYPFVGGLCVAIILIIAFPQICTFLPSFMRY